MSNPIESLPAERLNSEQAARFVRYVADDSTLVRGWDRKSATLDGPRRFTLTRGEPPFLGLVMLNPSTADGLSDDPTIRKCKGFAERTGLKGITVGNLFTLRTPHPRELLAKLEAGELAATPACDLALERVIADAEVLAFAWGALAGKLARYATPRIGAAFAIAARLGKKPIALGLTASGAPRHPLMLSYTSEPQELRL